MISNNTIKDKICTYMSNNALTYTEQDVDSIYWIIQGILCYKIFEESFIEEAVILYINTCK